MYGAESGDACVPNTPREPWYEVRVMNPDAPEATWSHKQLLGLASGNENGTFCPEPDRHPATPLRGQAPLSWAASHQRLALI